MKILKFFFIILFLQYSTNAGPIPGKAVYIKKSNKIFVFSFGRNYQSDNKLFSIDLNKSFNTLNAPVEDLSSVISGSDCPVMHFAQALPDADGVSVNIFGSSSVNNIYEMSTTICQYNTLTGSWGRLGSAAHGYLARRNAAYEFTYNNLTVIYGGTSEPLTGLNNNSPKYPYFWHDGISIFDSRVDQWVTIDLRYSGPTRSNATITQISDTNNQLVILGGALITNTSEVDMVTNFPLAPMSDIVTVDIRTSIWKNITAIGEALPAPRKHHTTTLHPDGHTLVLIGGENFDSTSQYVLNDVWTLDTSEPNNYVWKQPTIKGTGLSRSNHTSILIDDQIWVIAGTNSTAKAVDIQILNVTSWTWSYIAVTNYSPPEKYASIGGIKGLIGLIIGLSLFMLTVTCGFVFWCRKKDFNRLKSNKKPSSSSSFENQEYSYYDIQNNYLANDTNDLNTHFEASTAAGSKTTTSGPSVSTPISPHLGDWNPLHASLQRFSSSNNIPSYVDSQFNPPQNYSGQIMKAGLYDSNRLYEDINYTDTKNGKHRSSLGYWDPTVPPSHLLSHQVAFMIDPNNSLAHSELYQENPQRFSNVTVTQPLNFQKPNELDAPNYLPEINETLDTQASKENIEVTETNNSKTTQERR